MKEILDLKKKERLFIEKNIADIDREELKETYKVDDKTLDKIIQDGAHEGSLILIIARSSADASADESSDNFLKKICFSLIFSLF